MAFVRLSLYVGALDAEVDFAVRGPQTDNQPTLHEIAQSAMRQSSKHNTQNTAILRVKTI